MATDIVKMVAGSKLKEVTGDIEGALGVDAESETARSKETDRKLQREKERRQEEREREKEQRHEDRELERQRIREKYALNKDPKAKSKEKSSVSSHQRTTKEPTPEKEGKGCVLS